MRRLLLAVTLLASSALAQIPPGKLLPDDRGMTVTRRTRLQAFASGLVNDFSVTTWESAPIPVDLAAPAPGRPGALAMEVTFGAANGWNAVGLARRVDWNRIFWLYLNQFRTIEFDIFFVPGTSGAENLSFVFEDSGLSDGPTLTRLIPGWSGMTSAQRYGTWHHVVVDLAAIHAGSPSRPAFHQFLLFNGAEGASSRPHFFLADVFLSWVPDATPPVVNLAPPVPSLTHDALTLSFTTDEAAVFQVDFGPTPGYGRTVQGSGYQRSHLAVLRDLPQGATVFYRVTALDHQFEPARRPNAGVVSGSFAMPAVPASPPSVTGLGATRVGSVTATVGWRTDRPASATLTYGKAGGAVLTRTAADFATERSFPLDLLEPSTTYTLTVTATDAFGKASAPASATFTTSAAASVDVTVTIDASRTHAISPWIYGYNAGGDIAGAPAGITLDRLGGNRWTAYNWENNASNAGTDWGPFSSDTYLGGGTRPAEAVRAGIERDRAAGAATLMTVPLQGFVAADTAGLVDIHDPDHLARRFRKVAFRKGSAFTSPPDTNDASVYVDEMLWTLRRAFPQDVFAPGAAPPTFVSLDNEPELWGFTHAEIQTGLVKPASYIERTVELTRAIKDVAPGAVTYGPVHYGFSGIVNWQGSPDFAGPAWFADHYLTELRKASERDGRRLLDVYDIHWYPEATVRGTRVTDLHGPELADDQVQAIVQTPRSYWDPSYREASWIADYLGGPVRILPRLQEKIAAAWPGTGLAVTEYNGGGSRHIAGTIAQADTLGLFGALGITAAAFWPMRDSPYIDAGFRAFRSFDGAGTNFGDQSLATTSSNVADVVAYASRDSGNPQRVVLVAINRAAAARTVRFVGLPSGGIAGAFRMTADSTRAQENAGEPLSPNFVGQVPVSGSAWDVALPALSVTTIAID